jgi:hypothetical protein
LRVGRRFFEIRKGIYKVFLEIFKPVGIKRIEIHKLVNKLLNKWFKGVIESHGTEFKSISGDLKMTV